MAVRRDLKAGGDASPSGRTVRLAAWVRGWPQAFRDSLLPYLRVVCLLPRVSRLLTAGVAGGAIFGAAIPVGLTVATGALVGSVATAVQAGADSPAGAAPVQALLAVGVLFLAERAVGPVRATFAGLLGRRLDRHLQERVMRAVGRPVGIAHLEDAAVADLMAQAQGVGGGGYTAGGTVGPLANAAGLWLQSLGSAALLARFSPGLAALLFGAWIVAASADQREYLRNTRLAAAQTGAVRRAGYWRDLVLTPAAAKELRLWGMLEWVTGRFREAWWHAVAPQWAARARGSRVRAGVFVGLGGVQLLVVGAVGLAAARGEIGLASLATYVGAVGGVGVLYALADESLRLAYGTATVPAVLALERRAAAVAAGQPLTGTRAVGDVPQRGIHLEGVTFRYPGRDVEVLAGVELFIPAGHSLAVVGVNGAGKTTLIKLLCRLYDPTDGRILVDGVDLRELDARAWRRRLAAIFQDFLRYHLTARDNVAFGHADLLDSLAPLDGRRPDAPGPETQRRIEEAARKAGVLDVVEALPRGWDTVLSRQFTDGADLSGGQWQRLALARALFAVSGGARVLILDEPTANLDVRAEAALYDRFLDFTRGLTTLVISHRFSTVRRADRICVLAQGRVVEQGPHDELLAAGGHYAEMFRLQASRFVHEPAELRAPDGPGGSASSNEPKGVAPRSHQRPQPSGRGQDAGGT